MLVHPICRVQTFLLFNQLEYSVQPVSQTVRFLIFHELRVIDGPHVPVVMFALHGFSTFGFTPAAHKDRLAPSIAQSPGGMAKY